MLKSCLVIGALAFSTPAFAQAAQSAAPAAFPNLTIIYLASGVINSAGAVNTGYATSAQCTNWTGAAIQIRHIVRSPGGTVVAVKTYNVPALDTLSASTHGTQIFGNEAAIMPGVGLVEGSWQILSTSPNVTCTMTIVDAASAGPTGFPVHLVRFNAMAGSVE
jgi:hypothetical protein